VSSVEESFALGPDGTRLYVRRRSAGSPVTAILCDGIACDGFIWKYLWEDFGRIGSVAHWNYRGHGRSGSPADPTRLELAHHAEDLGEVVKHVGAGPVVLVGHSMGCQVVLEACRSAGLDVRGLILICGASGRITHTFKGSNALAQMLPRVIERVDAFPGLFRAIWGHVPAELGARFAKFTGEVDARSVSVEDILPYMRHMVDIDLPMFLRMLRSAGDHSALDLLPSLDMPSLVIAGENDTFTPPAYAEEMAALLPKSELVLVQGGTHVVPLEQPDIVRARVEAFMRERVAR